MYPFNSEASSEDELVKEQMEWVDVGGPSMLRAGAKNYKKSTTVVCDPKDYNFIEKRRETLLDSNEKAFSGIKTFFLICLFMTTQISNALKKEKDSG